MGNYAVLMRKTPESREELLTIRRNKSLANDEIKRLQYAYSLSRGAFRLKHIRLGAAICRECLEVFDYRNMKNGHCIYCIAKGEENDYKKPL